MARSGRPRVEVEPHHVRVIEATPVVRARARRIKWLRRQLGGTWERREKWRKRRGKWRKIYQWRKRWDFARRNKIVHRLSKIVATPIKKSAIREIDFPNQKQLEALIARRIDLNRPNRMAFEAACLLLSIERGADSGTIQRTAIFQKINQYAHAREQGPHGKWHGPRALLEFLAEFIQTYAPGWDWRKDADEGERQERKRIAREIYHSDNEWIAEDIEERMAKEIAEDARFSKARTSKFYTPDVPDLSLLFGLAWERRRGNQVIRSTWPSLRELKLATAIPERVIKKIIANLRPRKGEIVKQPIRNRSSKSGTVPRRYGPRLVIGVIDEFVNRLPEFPIDDQARKRLRKTAMRVNRAFVTRLSRSRSSI